MIEFYRTFLLFTDPSPTVFRSATDTLGLVKSWKEIGRLTHAIVVLSEKLNNMSSAKDKLDKAPDLSWDMVPLPS